MNKKNKNSVFVLTCIVFVLVTFLLFLFNMITISHIIQIIIAIGALSTAYYARRSFEKTNQMFEEERLSKRGYLATSKELGKLEYNELIMSFTNYGNNTIKDIVVDILIYTKNSISSKDKKHKYYGQVYSTNPLPHNQPFEIHQPLRSVVLNTSLNQYYIIARTKYYDIMLEKTFEEEYFYWEFGKENVFCEITTNEVKSIEDNLKFDKEFWTSLTK